MSAVPKCVRVEDDARIVWEGNIGADGMQASQQLGECGVLTCETTGESTTWFTLSLEFIACINAGTLLDRRWFWSCDTRALTALSVCDRVSSEVFEAPFLYPPEFSIDISFWLGEQWSEAAWSHLLWKTLGPTLKSAKV